MSVIDDFIKQYEKDFDYYQTFSQVVASKIEDQLIKRGIKAIVTYRAKRSDRVRAKIERRNTEQQYTTVADITKDIFDLAGIRVSLYFPSDREIIDEIINEIFHIERTKKYPDTAHTPKYTKRFSGYWATHYRVKIKEEGRTERELETIAEIQVASVLMHAWSEVEHDLVYKPFSGELSREELAILDEINGLVLSGEIALERLQSAMAERTGHKKNVTDKFELTNYLINSITSKSKAHNLGNTSMLNNYLNTTKSLDIKKLDGYIDNINIDSKDSVTDQILNGLLVSDYDTKKPNLKAYFENLNIPKEKAAAFVSYVKCWVVLEKAAREFLTDEEIKSRKYIISDFKILREKNVLIAEETAQLSQIRQVRNYLLHGVETPSESYAENRFQILRSLTAKVIDKIPTEATKEKLKKELSTI